MIALPSPPHREGAGNPPLKRGQIPRAQKSFPDPSFPAPTVSVDTVGEEFADEVGTFR